MKNFYCFCISLFLTQITFGQVSVSPNPFEIDESITITVNLNSNATDCNGLNNPNKVYAHLGLGTDGNEYGTSVVGNWGQDDGIGEMTNNGNGVWSITLTPNTYFSLTPQQEQVVTKIGMVFRNADGTQELKATGCSNFIFDVGTFQVTLTSPSQDSTTILNQNQDFEITASNIGGNANYVLKANGTIINTQNNIASYSYTDSSIVTNKNYELEVSLNGSTITKRFNVLIDPGNQIAVMPTNYQDGITYLNDSEAVLVLYATAKDFVYVAGSFNNYQPTSAYAMKKDPTRNNKFWITLTGLTPGQIETYQYWVVDKTPLANSPSVVKTADPYSTLVLSPFDDPGIPSNSYPNIPAYPQGQEREVTVLQTGQTPYNWQVTDFEKPKKEDLVIYEVLIRDFDLNRNFQDLINRIDYFKNLNINAIELMPVMEFEGNESWGYNTAFHMALDKFYGTEDKFKEFVDVCHQNGIAVILDVALNHAFGRNPMVRMWMDDPDGDGWGGPSAENPYFNQVATHSYSVGSDFDHSNPRTKDYTKRVVKHWIEEFHIDGFRWDLTKGFTQNCSPNDEGCTNSTQPDRVAVLKEYADYSWSLDDTHYVIFEHLGSAAEERQWADYRLDEGKGIMLWGKMTDPYAVLARGYATDPNGVNNGAGGNLTGVGSESRGFAANRLVGYAESHDEERVLYDVLTHGNTNGQNTQTLENRTKRMSSVGAALFTVPGPKMIWHFGELGMENSIFTCNNGTVNEPGGGNGDCKLDTKPQPQWAQNWPNDVNRNGIYNTWSRLINLKINEPVFEGTYSIETQNSNLKQRISVSDTNLPNTSLNSVIVLINFDVTAQSIVPNFTSTGTWFDLMDETGASTINVSNVSAPISVPAGEFRIFGNTNSTLNTTDFSYNETFKLYPNPVNTSFSINTTISNLEIYDITGKLVKAYQGSFIKNSEFNISNLKNGIYIVKAKNNSGSQTTTKLVKI
ncbi:alpha-amylase family glycosyl hydrolase [Bizionia echini]|uniref:alpha-amylase family glycosyl hydrolase n=1 Tax=Bizionia echini TaxID=649333 RepID=UPI0030D7F19B